MTGQDYEYVVADYLRSRGYHGVKVTKGSGDFGVDVIATKNGIKYAVQCKLYSSPVGVSAVQEVVAGKAYYGCKGAMVVTNSTFTAAAQKLADMNDVILLDGIKSSKPRGGITIKKVLIYLLWLGAVGGIITEIMEPIDPSGTLTSIFLIPLVSLPFWIKPVFQLIKKHISQNNSDAEPVQTMYEDLPVSVPAEPPTHYYPTPTPTSSYSIEELEDAAKVVADAICASMGDYAEDPGILASIIALVVHERSCTVSLIQRRLKLGYTKAALLVDILEEHGIVGPFMGSKPRAVLMTDSDLMSKSNKPFS